MPRILLIADVSNLYYTLRKRFRRNLNYKKLLDFAKEKGEVVKALAYGAEINGKADSFKTALEYIGFECKFKTPKVFRRPNSEREDRKADWDVGIVVDIISAIDSFDILILGSADGDFVPCFEMLREKGKECIVMACRISNELKLVSSSWYEIDENLLE